MLYGVIHLQARIGKWCFMTFLNIMPEYRQWEDNRSSCVVFCFIVLLLRHASYLLIVCTERNTLAWTQSFFIALLALHDLSCYILINSMTAYGFTHSRHVPFPSSSITEARQKRRKVWEAVYERRKFIYKRFYQKKRRLQAGSNLATMA